MRLIFHKHLNEALIAVSLLLATCLAANAECPQKSVAKERYALEAKLSAKGYSKAEKAFLLRGASSRLKEIRKDMLNARGRECGIESIRAYVLGCIIRILPPNLLTDRKTGASYWGKPNVSAREAAFVGVFHACRAGALGAFVES